CSKSRESPLIFQFIKAVLAITTVTIKLCNRFQGVSAIGHPHRVFPHACSLHQRMVSKFQTDLMRAHEPRFRVSAYVPSLLCAHYSIRLIGACLPTPGGPVRQHDSSLIGQIAKPQGVAHFLSDANEINNADCVVHIPAICLRCHSHSAPDRAGALLAKFVQ
ncbi:MAG: hypothetical protein K0R08_2127, partial [Solimicrobium sp.]|nr:hypothetical protein [Solimicrobium sp.]